MSNTTFLGEVSKRRTFAIISHPDAAQPFNA
nr:peptide chain release factor 3 [Vibrio hepatarius]